MIRHYWNSILLFIPLIVGQQLSAQTTLNCFVNTKNIVRGCSGGKDCIPTLTNSPIIPANEATYLSDESLVLGVYQNGIARAYPHTILWWHEVLNDTLNGKKYLITLCPLTSTGLLFDATINGVEHDFGISGLIYNNNLIMYDRVTGVTIFPQMCFIGKNGALEGEQLKLLPIMECTWSAWKALHPNTTVLSDNTGINRPYNVYPYGDYRTNEVLLYPLTNDDRRLPRKDIILGVRLNNIARAYPFKAMGDQAVLNDRIGATNVLIIFSEKAKLALPFYREVDGQETEFALHEVLSNALILFKDNLTGSVWNMKGEAISGPMANSGAVLDQIPAYTSMWFGWAAFHAATQIADIDGLLTSVDSNESTIAPVTLALHQNYPNPFNPVTKISYTLQQASRVALKVYDITGKEVKTLVNDITQQAGHYNISWFGRDNSGQKVASGMYFYKIYGGGKTMSLKMVLLQ